MSKQAEILFMKSNYIVRGVRGSIDYIEALEIVAKQSGPSMFDHSYCCKKSEMSISGDKELDLGLLEEADFTVQKI